MSSLSSHAAVNNSSHAPLVFSYWKFDAGGADAAEKRRQIVNDIVVPMFADVVILTDAACIYARKYTVNKPEDIHTPGLEPADEVRLYIATRVTDRSKMGQLVARHVPNGRHVSGPLDYPAKDRACLPDCVWYRRALTNAAAVALDLHTSPALDTHRQYIRGLYRQGGLRGFTRAALEPYLLAHAPHYPAGNEQRAVFWHDFLRWGPAPNLFPAGHLLANLTLIV